jgi:hypothetical protein
MGSNEDELKWFKRNEEDFEEQREGMKKGEE